MKHWEARKQAEEIIANARMMNASCDHPETARQASIAGMVIDLCSQLEKYEPEPSDESALPTERETHWDVTASTEAPNTETVLPEIKTEAVQ